MNNRKKKMVWGSKRFRAWTYGPPHRTGENPSAREPPPPKFKKDKKKKTPLQGVKDTLSGPLEETKED